MDAIRARGFLRFTYVYKPPNDIKETIKGIAEQVGLKLDAEKWQNTHLSNYAIKEELLKKIGEQHKHYVPNSQLHKIYTLSSLVEFYSTPVKNITKYAEMARSDNLPKNIAIRENPFRFHPDDKDQPHQGIPAFPGEGGEVFGLRNKRIYRQYRAKKEWFEFEDQSFSYDDVSKGMPWDLETAKTMDTCTDKRFISNRIEKI